MAGLGQQILKVGNNVIVATTCQEDNDCYHPEDPRLEGLILALTKIAFFFLHSYLSFCFLLLVFEYHGQHGSDSNKTNQKDHETHLQQTVIEVVVHHVLDLLISHILGLIVMLNAFDI